MSELEVSVWCLAADATAGSRLVWYLPYVFVDSGQAVASGREVYGYPKQIGLFEDDYPDALGERGDDHGLRRWRSIRSAPNEEARLRPMISAERQPPSRRGRRPAGRASPTSWICSPRGSRSRRTLPFGPAAAAVGGDHAGRRSAAAPAPAATVPGLGRRAGCSTPCSAASGIGDSRTI